MRLSGHHELSQEKHDLVMIWALVVSMPKLVALSTLEICPLVALPGTSLRKAVPVSMSILLAKCAEYEPLFPLFFEAARFIADTDARHERRKHFLARLLTQSDAP